MPEAKKAITAGQVRARLAGTRLPADPLAVDFSGFHERMPDQLAQRLKQKLRPAGVLIPIIDRGTELSVLLTRRSHDLKHHAGQVSFPGGAMEDHDADIGATALRETYEEVIKIHPNQKAIISSGFAETDEVKETQKLGAGKYIKKPLTLEKIGPAVKEELERL